MIRRFITWLIRPSVERVLADNPPLMSLAEIDRQLRHPHRRRPKPSRPERRG